VPGLWTHQGDLLRTYTGVIKPIATTGSAGVGQVVNHLDDPDLALELPTGTGKTLPGLVIADWVRCRRSGRVAYACPTRQLARQVAKVAAREGIPIVTLTGKHANWSTADKATYEGAEAIAVTTYSTIFNSNPKLAVPDLLLFDDAHAGEQYVGEQYAISIRRNDVEPLYTAVLDILAPAIDGIPLQRLRDPAPDPGMYRSARLVVPLRQPDMVTQLDALMSQLPAPWSFRYSMIRDVIATCLVYVSHSTILIRPVIPPAANNPVFATARQRIYLSATLGSGGELERAFGRAPITRIALPETTPTPGPDGGSSSCRNWPPTPTRPRSPPRSSRRPARRWFSHPTPPPRSPPPPRWPSPAGRCSPSIRWPRAWSRSPPHRTGSAAWPGWPAGSSRAPTGTFGYFHVDGWVLADISPPCRPLRSLTEIRTYDSHCA